MPRKPRKQRKRPGSGLTDQQNERLIRGYNILSCPRPFIDDAEMMAAWKKNRRYFLFLQGKPTPGTILGEAPWFVAGQRPWGFYFYDVGDEQLYWAFGSNRIRGQHIEQFEYLKANGYLFDGEEIAFFELQIQREQGKNDRKITLKNDGFEG